LRRFFIALAVAGFLTYLHFEGTMEWLQLDHSVPCADEAYHLRLGLECRQLLCNETPREILRKLPLLDVGYPPLAHLWVALLNGCEGGNRRTSTFAMLDWFFVVLACTYGLTRRLGGPTAALRATLLAAFCPLLYVQTRTFLPELPLAAMVMLAVLLLELSDGLRRPFWTVLLGLCSGAGLLAKYSFPLYLAGPVLITLVRAWRRARCSGVLRLGLAGLFVTGLALAVAAPWYATDWATRWAWLQRQTQLVWQPFDSSWSSPFGATFYLLCLASFPGMPLYLLLTAAGLAALLVRKHPARGLLVPWLVVAWLWLTLMPIKWGEYLVPLLAPMSMAAAIGLTSGLPGGGPERPGRLRRLGRASVTAAIFLAGVALYLPITYGIDRTLPDGYHLNPGVETCLLGPKRWVHSQVLGLLPNADAALFKSDWYGYSSASYPLFGVLAAIRDQSLPGLVVVSADPQLSADSLTYRWAALQQGLPLRIVDIQETQFYHPTQLEAMILHTHRPLMEPAASFGFLMDAAGLELPKVGGERAAAFRLIAQAATVTGIVHVYTRLH
jgi:4-amino-4-deoxy-L-arabinose transferase-like glycosyltransferase